MLAGAPSFLVSCYADLEIETAGMTWLVVVFTLFTSSTNSPIQLIVEDQQTNRLALDFLNSLAQNRNLLLDLLKSASPHVLEAFLGPRRTRGEQDQDGNACARDRESLKITLLLASVDLPD